jgi:hypothetical protein
MKTKGKRTEGIKPKDQVLHSEVKNPVPKKFSPVDYIPILNVPSNVKINEGSEELLKCMRSIKDRLKSKFSPIVKVRWSRMQDFEEAIQSLINSSSRSAEDDQELTRLQDGLPKVQAFEELLNSMVNLYIGIDLIRDYFACAPVETLAKKLTFLFGVFEFPDTKGTALDIYCKSPNYSIRILVNDDQLHKMLAKQGLTDVKDLTVFHFPMIELDDEILIEKFYPRLIYDLAKNPDRVNSEVGVEKFLKSQFWNVGLG